MKKSHILGLLAGGLVLTALSPAGAQGAESALCEAPARSAAIIARVPGFKSYDLDLYIGKRTINEGVVIRKSHIDKGKIIIPPEGLYYSSRLGSIGTMTGLDVVMLGKRQPVVNEEYEYIIVKNRKLKLGESLKLHEDGSRLLQFTASKGHPYGNAANSATVRIMKASGNYYGTNFTVAISPTLKDFSSGKYNDGLGLPEGRYPLPADKTSPLQHNTYFTSSTYPSGQSYLIAEKAGMDEISIKEFGTPSLTRIWLSSAPRISGAYAPGDSAAAGGARVDVLAVSPSAVSLRLTEENGSVTEKTFRGLDDSSVLDYLPSSAHDRAKWQLNSPDGKISVQLAMLRPGGVVQNGRVFLDIYTDIYEIGNPQEWPSDPRFLARPDT
ncbi:MAG TPA: hypothetical protein H9991_04555 [Candidatus Mailhella excrementigallinarum]|nr:hypothetical protein [Candidatus Mailhella excrementigallinarum]